MAISSGTPVIPSDAPLPPDTIARAPDRASSARSPSAENTTHTTRARRPSSARRISVPPQPISRSSACAPRARTVSGGPPKPSVRIVGASALPASPGRAACGIQALERLHVLERVHRRPEARVPVGQELAVRDQPLERLLDQLVAWLQVVEDLPAQDEVPAVDPDVGIVDVRDAGDEPLFARVDDVERIRGPDGEERRDLVAAP